MVTLDQVHDVYKKHFYLEDTDNLDANLAVCKSLQMLGRPLWLINIGGSGGNKSGLVGPLRDWSKVHVEQNFTTKTLVNGNKKGKPFDLAPKLDGKILLLPDLAQLLTLHPNEKANLWAQLRDLYDGYAGRSTGTGASRKYTGLKVGFIANSTASIDSQILIFSHLGTRELLYRLKPTEELTTLMDKCIENEGLEETIINEISSILIPFLKNTRKREVSLTTEVLNEIKEISQNTAKLRATGEFDSYTHELRNLVTPEIPSRLVMQLKKLYVCLMSLDKKYKHEDAIRIIEHIGSSSINPIRLAIYKYLESDKVGRTTSEIAIKFGIGKSTVKRECLVLEQVGLIDCERSQETSRGYLWERWRYLNA